MPESGQLSCAELLDRLPRFLDADLDGADTARVESHLARCERCLRKHRFERVVLDELRRKLAGVRAPEALRARLEALFATSSTR